MTDKQIIIDGVDVRGCTYSQIGIDRKCYCEQDLYNDGTPVFTCDECPNCCYKQLARKTQEYEELTKNYFIVIQQRNKAEKTLTDIKEIVEENFYFLDCDYRWILEKILQKISEVEN